MPPNTNSLAENQGAAEKFSETFAANTNSLHKQFQSSEQGRDLWAELRIARANRDVDDILQRHGVTDPNAKAICGLARIVRMGNFFEFHSSGEYAVIVPVIAGDDVVDLLAFDPSKPEEWWYRIGGERLLDGDALGDQLLGKPLQIYRTPLNWLKGRCDGVVIFDTNRAFIDLATAPNGVVGEDDEHTEELRRTMSATAQRNLPVFLKRISV